MSALPPKADIPETGGLRQRDDLIDVLFDGGDQCGTPHSQGHLAGR